MFDITGDDIQKLTDADLRTLVARLALGELARQGLPQSAVTAGGHQDAKDGGIDVMVDLDHRLTNPDFVPRPRTGFQVKKPDMPAGEIRDEMLPKGALRKAISDLADAGGAYIIASAQGSVAYTALAGRRNAMRDALAGHPYAHNLHTDFYDRDRIAIWVNAYPGAACWVRDRVGGPISGWRPIGQWAEAEIAANGDYIVDDGVSVVDQQLRKPEKLEVNEGIARIRALLAVPGKCVRLIGMSGLGKTRLVEALFERGVGETPLDPALSVYTDFADEITPTAHDMARRLLTHGKRVILIVDNCNPATHARLATICSAPGSPMSLLTVEYDVQDDEPERTDVFRLVAAGNRALGSWIERNYPYVSQLDRTRIADFSGGNFRIARLVVETLKKGETLAHLRNRELFERFFQQRTPADERLLEDSEALALLYSFDGKDDGPDGELGRLATFAKRSLRDLFRATEELKSRGIIQVRGRWRAVLPQALAAQLATRALERTPPSELDAFYAALPARMLRSLSRRLGLLHDCSAAQEAVSRLLRGDGPLGDLFALGEPGFDILSNIAPVDPDKVLSRMEEVVSGSGGRFDFAVQNRLQWMSLIRSLAYDEAAFDRAARLLARFVAGADNGDSSTSDISHFTELFHLYLSGTLATPARRRTFTRDLLSVGDMALNRAGLLALDGLLETRNFTSSANFDFGARPRDFGWQPATGDDIADWFNEAIALALEFVYRFDTVRTILASSLRELWLNPAYHDALEMAATRLAGSGGWIEGWNAFSSVLRSDRNEMPDEMRVRLISIIDLLRPADLLQRARAYVVGRGHGGIDVLDGVYDDFEAAYAAASEVATEIGRAGAIDHEFKARFLPEVFSTSDASRGFEFGRGLAQGAQHLEELWVELVDNYRLVAMSRRNATALGGFLSDAHRGDKGFAGRVLEAAIVDPDLVHCLPYLESRVPFDATSLDRLTRVTLERRLDAGAFFHLAVGSIVGDLVRPFSDLLLAVANLDKGVSVAVNLAYMYCLAAKNRSESIDANLLECGRELLGRVDFTDVRSMNDYRMGALAKLTLSGPAGAAAARQVCENLRACLDNGRYFSHNIDQFLSGLFQAQPEIALDIFLLPDLPQRNRHLFSLSLGHKSPIEKLDVGILRRWADRDPQERYPLIGRTLSLFKTDQIGEAKCLSPLFLSVMEGAPDKRAFLGPVHSRSRPSSWSGSLVDILYRRKDMLKELLSHNEPTVREWTRENQNWLDQMIALERKTEGAREEGFE